jgi:hypothetical protein
MKTAFGKPKLKAGIIYSADNGALICLRCAGISALYTGCDVSGQKVEAVPFAGTVAWKKEFGKHMACEHGCTSYERIPCGFKGCKCHASVILTATMGVNKPLPLCDEHTPEWVKTGEPSEFAKKFGREYFTVEKL